MKKAIFIIIPLLLTAWTLKAQDDEILVPTQMDSIALGNLFGTLASGNTVYDATMFGESPEVDVAKAMYGRFSGLLVKQGKGRSEENESSLRLHGQRPLVLVDGFPRSLSEITSVEIESVTVLKDAASAALYGVKGANGVISITTKRGTVSPLKVTAKYQYGIGTMFRAPEFSDAYTYALKYNEALTMDGLAVAYNDNELAAFKSGEYPYSYPNVDWWNEIYRSHSDNHRMQLTFTGGNRNFRYFTAVDYMKDNALYRKPSTDDRYNANTYDNRLGIRANVDVNITETTSMKLGLMARLTEFNRPYWEKISGETIEKTLYNTPAAAFPIKQEDGVYGGSSIYGVKNPYALHNESGNHLYSNTAVLANISVRQDLGMLVKGLSADVNAAFDYLGDLTEVSWKEWRYSELSSSIDASGNLSTFQSWYGTDAKTMSYDHWLHTLGMRFEMVGKLNYERSLGRNHFTAHAAYRQRSYIINSRNESKKSQEILGTLSYNWGGKLFADAVLNYAGTAYLPKGDRFRLYPALSLAYVVKPGTRVFASVGVSGYDENMEHELFLQTYGSSNAHSYKFGTEAKSASGRAEGDIAALSLAPESVKRATLGFETRLLKDRLAFKAEGFMENRSGILIEPSNISGVIGIGVKEQSLGEEKYKGFDLGLDWSDRSGDLTYGFYANGGWLFSEVVNDGQAFQNYDYLYHKGNPVGQCYGLEVIGIFQNEYEINNSPKQTFGDVRPGDLKYRDQNGDGRIDGEDVVKMFGSSIPMLNFGFGLRMGWRDFSFFADFQGVTGVTVSLRDSPLYKPLVNHSTISDTFLSREIPWTPETASTATMPRLTTQDNSNNYRSNSLWYRDGSFIKLRNVGVSYNLPENLSRFAKMQLTLNATNLLCFDNLGFCDPEQLGAYYPATRGWWAGIKFIF